MDVFLVIDARERMRADPKRVIGDQTERLRLTCKATFRTDIVILRKRCTLRQEIRDLVKLRGCGRLGCQGSWSVRRTVRMIAKHQIDRFGEAIAPLERLVALDPELARARQLLAIARRRAGG